MTGGGFGGGRNFDQGPPERVIPFGYYDYSCQDDLVLKVEIEDVPYFNAPIFLENKSQIGKVDEIFGNLRDYSVSVKLGDNMKVSSFTPKQKLYIDPGKLLPLNRFLPKPPGQKGSGGRGGPRGGVQKRGGVSLKVSCLSFRCLLSICFRAEEVLEIVEEEVAAAVVAVLEAEEAAAVALEVVVVVVIPEGEGVEIDGRTLILEKCIKMNLVQYFFFLQLILQISF